MFSLEDILCSYCLNTMQILPYLCCHWWYCLIDTVVIDIAWLMLSLWTLPDWNYLWCNCQIYTLAIDIVCDTIVVYRCLVDMVGIDISWLLLSLLISLNSLCRCQCCLTDSVVLHIVWLIVLILTLPGKKFHCCHCQI